MSSFTLSRKDKANKDTHNDAYKWGVIDQQIKEILSKLDKIDLKLDTFDKEVEEKINNAMENHIKIYHRGE